jgi:hypothetical protein
MILGALLLLLPVPQTADTPKVVAETPVTISYNISRDDDALTAAKAASETKTVPAPSAALPSAPDAKVKTDAELAAEPAPAPTPFLAVKPTSREPYESPAKKKAWFALMAASHAGAAFDAWSTRRAISGGFGTESNPMLRPFAHSNALYAATQVSPLVMDYLGRRMMRSEHPLLRKLWWLPQSAGGAMSFAAGAHNVGVVH